ncbi:hypothetical protein, partial [Paenibacillus allorhizoplanae]|uniref:hypothetical protein n=1 Tax=Paenibacillus allorhizoplanae TaxID=2905648 RepID=UPI001F1A5816
PYPVPPLFTNQSPATSTQPALTCDPDFQPTTTSSVTLNGFYTAILKGKQRKFQLDGIGAVNLSHLPRYC